MSKILGVHIKPPESVWQSWNLVVGAVTTPPTEGSGVVKSAQWKREGDSIRIRYQYSQTGAGASGSGIYIFPLPIVNGVQLTINTTKLTASNSTHASTGTAVGSGHMGQGETTGGIKPVMAMVYDSTGIRISTDLNGTTTQPWGSGQSNSYGDPTLAYSFDALVPVTQWSSNDILRISDDTKI